MKIKIKYFDNAKELNIENNKEKYPKLLKKKIGYYWGKPKW